MTDGDNDSPHELNRITALGENRSHVYSPRNTTCMEYLKSQITFVSSADCYC